MPAAICDVFRDWHKRYAMKRTVYLETSIIGYLASRPSRDLLTAANQQLTHDWWIDHRGSFELRISQFVLNECNAGDPTAAQERSQFLDGLPLLAHSEEIQLLADELVRQVPLPNQAEVDALHIATAAVHGVDYLLTWNCKHIANASFRGRIEAICHAVGYDSPTICTPQELMEN